LRSKLTAQALEVGRGDARHRRVILRRLAQGGVWGCERKGEQRSAGVENGLHPVAHRGLEAASDVVSA
jgi:hypothetical protein